MFSLCLALTAQATALPLIAEDGAVFARPVPAPVQTEAFDEPGVLDDPSQARPFVAPLVRDHELDFVESPGALWARGRTYKASASPEGFTYVPYLGSEASRTYPVRFRLESATLAGAELELNDLASVERNGARVTLDRGPVDVVYDFALDSVEQSFAVDAAGAAGELQLILSVETDLVGRKEGAGMRFDGAEGGMHYGAAIVLDGRGRRADVAAELLGDRLTLTVPAAFLASAEGLVIVDPVLNTWAVDQLTSENLLEPDVAYDVTSDNYLYTYEEQFAVGDTDIYFRRYDQSGALQAERYVVATLDNEEDPEIATQNFSDTALIVYTASPASGFSEVKGRILDIATNTLGSELLIGSSANIYDNRRADVGGNGSTNSAGVYLVGWVRDFAGGYSLPRFRTVAPNGTLGSTQFITNDSTKIMDEVVISKGVGLTSVANYWSVAYRSEDMMSGDVSIRGAQFHWDGTVRNGDAELFLLPAGDDAIDLDISDTIEVTSTSPSYCIVYDEVGPGDEDVWVMMCRDNVRIGRTELALIEHGDTGRNQLKPRLATTRDDFIVSFLEQRPGSLNFDVYVTTFQPIAGALLAIAERRTVVGETGALWSGGAAMASRMSGGNSGSSWLGMGWSIFETIAGNSSWNVAGARFSSSFADPVGFQYCYGAPNSTGDRGFLAIFGDQSIDQLKTLSATALPPNSVGYFAVGSLPVSVPNVAGSQGTLCIAGVVGRYSNFVTSSGPTGTISLTIDPTMLPVPTGSAPAMAGQLRGFQLWHRDSVNGAATSNFTNAATIFFQ